MKVEFELRTNEERDELKTLLDELLDDEDVDISLTPLQTRILCRLLDAVDKKPDGPPVLPIPG